METGWDRERVGLEKGWGMAKSAWYWRQAGKEHKAKSWIGEQAEIQLKIGLGNKLQKSKKLDWKTKNGIEKRLDCRTGWNRA